MAQIFVDTAKLEEIQEAASWGILDGVTTNPSLMFQAGTANRKEQTLKIEISSRSEAPRYRTEAPA